MVERRDGTHCGPRSLHMALVLAHCRSIPKFPVKIHGKISSVRYTWYAGVDRSPRSTVPEGGGQPAIRIQIDDVLSEEFHGFIRKLLVEGVFAFESARPRRRDTEDLHETCAAAFCIASTTLGCVPPIQVTHAPPMASITQRPSSRSMKMPLVTTAFGGVTGVLCRTRDSLRTLGLWTPLV
jgi:hypothetical protein